MAFRIALQSIRFPGEVSINAGGTNGILTIPADVSASFSPNAKFYLSSLLPLSQGFSEDGTIARLCTEVGVENKVTSIFFTPVPVQNWGVPGWATRELSVVAIPLVSELNVVSQTTIPDEAQLTQAIQAALAAPA